MQRKGKYFYPIILLLISAMVSLVGAALKLEHVSGWGVILTIGILLQLVGIVWFLVALLGQTHHQSS